MKMWKFDHFYIENSLSSILLGSRVPIHYYYSHAHSNLEWEYLLASNPQVK